jgi:ABC-type phosphate/phosphonate transport system permease subunit
MIKDSSSKQVRLRLVHIDFWSATKNSFIVALSTAVILAVFNFGVWLLLTVLGVVDTLNGIVSSIIGVDFLGLTDLMSFPSVMVFTVVQVITMIVCGTVLGALGSLAFNFIARITGGIRIAFTND